jgi:nitrogen fixation/metabolism regulation signal transduction histidine kinase
LIQSVVLLLPDANIELDSEDLLVYADKDQLQQILVSLLKNVWESMHDNTINKINVYWRKDSPFIEVDVLDHGTGINNMDNFFVLFYTTKQQGTGIGMSLLRKILVNHGGDLSIRSRLGTTVEQATFLIPT